VVGNFECSVIQLKSNSPVPVVRVEDSLQVALKKCGFHSSIENPKGSKYLGTVYQSERRSCSHSFLSIAELHLLLTFLF